MDIVSSKTGKKRKKRGRLTPEERFNRAWRRVQNQQKKNAGFMDEVERFVEKVEQRIGERERRHAEAMYSACEHLVGFYRRKSLAQWQREALLEWVSEYLLLIASSPFADHLDMNALQEQCAAAVNAVHPPEADAARDKPEEPPPGRDEHRAGRDSQTEDMFEDLFGEFAGEGDEDGEPFGYEEDDPFEAFYREQREYDEARQQKTQSLSRLLKSTSVNKLFRKLAGVLHPDRERDADARERKNQLMGELTRARDDNDIPKIFSLYEDHVGESPLAEIDGDLDTLTRLLEERYQDLRQQEQEILASNPRSGMIYQRFYNKNSRAVQRSLDKHLKQLDESIADEKRLITEVTSVNKLKPLLEERRMMDMFGETMAEFERMVG